MDPTLSATGGMGCDNRDQLLLACALQADTVPDIEDLNPFECGFDRPLEGQYVEMHGDVKPLQFHLLLSTAAPPTLWNSDPVESSAMLGTVQKGIGMWRKWRGIAEADVDRRVLRREGLAVCRGVRVSVLRVGGGGRGDPRRQAEARSTVACEFLMNQPYRATECHGSSPCPSGQLFTC